MTKLRALVTGGAGFIGSHIVDGLIRDGYDVIVYDNLTPQVHGADQKRPAYLNSKAELIVKDVRDRDALASVLSEVDVVLHEAAAVGVGQSMYDIVSYVEANVVGTAVLCELLAKTKHRVKKVLVASSMSNYGEGKYSCPTHGELSPPLRSTEQLQARDWELRCLTCKSQLMPLGTDEDKALHPTSVYATTKRDQEELILNVCRAYGIPAVALRYFNIYGPRQSLSNPYTGVAAIFSSRILNDQSPMIFEDGKQSRDFTHVSDVVQANLLALRSDKADGEVLNVGTGTRTSLLDLTHMLLEYLGKARTVQPQILGKFREGDIRHCHADISRIRTTLGYEPSVSFVQGLPHLVAWAKNEALNDKVNSAFAELDRHNLVK